MMRQTSGAAPWLRLNPDDDDAFRRIVSAWQPVVWRPAALQTYLRDRYPAAVVRPRDLEGEERPTWYVYRDGVWVNPDRPEGRRPVREGRALRRRNARAAGQGT